MKLSEYVALQDVTGASDFQIIKMFIEENDLESEAIKLISDLSENKLNKKKRIINNFSLWAPYVIGLKQNNPSIELSDEVALNLERIILLSLAEVDLSDKSILEWAKENVPKMKIPYFFFRPAEDYLKKYGIEFMKEN